MGFIHLTNIVICYANEDEVLEYAETIERQTIKDALQLIIVVNKEGKGIEFLKKELSRIDIKSSILNPGKNLGYLNGLLYGYRYAETKTKWYVLTNTDIKIPNNNFFESFLESEYLKNDSIWVVGPSVYSSKSNSYSNPYMKVRPAKKTYQVKNFLMKWPTFYELIFQAKRILRAKRKDTNSDNSGEVYAVHGSFMFVSEELMMILSIRQPWELLYDEEQYIAEVCRENSKKIRYDAALLIHHLDGTSTGKVNVVNRYKRMVQSNRRIIEEFY